jgi:hypothetical protein
MFTEARVYAAIAATLFVIGASFYSGWEVKGWKDATEYKDLQLKVEQNNTAALNAAKTALETKTNENAKIGQQYEARISDLTAQLKSVRVRYSAAPTGSVVGKEPASGSSTPPAQQIDPVVTEAGLTEDLQAGLDDAVRLESLQDYVRNVCTK